MECCTILAHMFFCYSNSLHHRTQVFCPFNPAKSSGEDLLLAGLLVSSNCALYSPDKRISIHQLSKQSKVSIFSVLCRPTAFIIFTFLQIYYNICFRSRFLRIIGDYCIQTSKIRQFIYLWISQAGFSIVKINISLGTDAIIIVFGYIVRYLLQ